MSKKSALYRNETQCGRFFIAILRNLWYNRGMKHKRLTPKDAKNIVARATAGEKQKDIAADYGVHGSSISRIVKRAREKSKETAIELPRQDLSDRTTEQLQNRYRACHDEIYQFNEELRRNSNASQKLLKDITEATDKLKDITDPVYNEALKNTIIGYREQYVYLQDTKRTVFRLKVLYAEVSGLLHELSQRADGEVPLLRTFTIM